MSENQIMYSKNMKHFSNDGTDKTPYFFSLKKLTLFCLKTLVILLSITEKIILLIDKAKQIELRNLLNYRDLVSSTTRNKAQQL